MITVKLSDGSTQTFTDGQIIITLSDTQKTLHHTAPNGVNTGFDLTGHSVSVSPEKVSVPKKTVKKESVVSKVLKKVAKKK